MTNPFEIIDARLKSIECLILDIKLNPQEATPIGADKWFNLEQLCEYLPDKPAKATIYGHVHKNAIPCHKGAKKLRFLKSEIDEWLKKGKKKTVSEFSEEAEQFVKGRVKK